MHHKPSHTKAVLTEPKHEPVIITSAPRPAIFAPQALRKLTTPNLVPVSEPQMPWGQKALFSTKTTTHVTAPAASSPSQLHAMSAVAAKPPQLTGASWPPLCRNDSHTNLVTHTRNSWPALTNQNVARSDPLTQDPPFVPTRSLLQESPSLTQPSSTDFRSRQAASIPVSTEHAFCDRTPIDTTFREQTSIDSDFRDLELWADAPEVPATNYAVFVPPSILEPKTATCKLSEGDTLAPQYGEEGSTSDNVCPSTVSQSYVGGYRTKIGQPIAAAGMWPGVKAEGHPYVHKNIKTATEQGPKADHTLELLTLQTKICSLNIN